MPFYSFEMILVGIILLSGMVAGAIKLWLRKNNESKQSNQNDNSEPQNTDFF